MMTPETTEVLTAQWGTDPRPPVLPDPWERQVDPSERERTNRAALRNRPDLGWAFAERLAGSRRPCSILKRREYRWLRAAKHLLTGGTMAAKHLRDAEVVALARKYYESKEFRPVLNAALMTRGATVQMVADALKIKPPDLVKKFPAEQTAAGDPSDLGDFVGSARAILEGNKKIVEASIEQQRTQKAQVP